MTKLAHYSDVHIRDSPGWFRLGGTSKTRNVLFMGLLVGLIAILTAILMQQFRPPPPPDRWAGVADNQGEETEHKHTNHLINETSPYLLQHAHNPVNWYPWGDAAFKKAKEEDKPIFLSVGYSTCYWCHVMEKESFEDEEVADVLNEHIVAIKVDREERPDVDEQYMLATQMITGRGGWPNSVWLTPEGKPWMAGTYFPKPQFIQVLETLASYWDNRRQEVNQQAEQLSTSIAQYSQIRADSTVGTPVNQALIDKAVEGYTQSYDDQHGGFGGAPKFPPHGALRLLLFEYERTHRDDLLPMITGTLDAMWLGGMHDHLGGGFHRYSTDAEWLLPHFEKMLYDNAQLMRAYTLGFLLTGDQRYRQAVEGIYTWLEREMTDSTGGFHSALDSGDVGKEGESYVWHYEEVIKVLGEENGKLFAEIYNILPQGNFREEATGERTGANIPHLDKPLRKIADDRGLDPERLRLRMSDMRQTLLTHRQTWPQPHKDDKILTSWNALMIDSLARAGRAFEEPRYTRAAVKAAEFILTSMVDDEGNLLHTYRLGRAKQPAFLDDYAYLSRAWLEVYAATQDKKWLKESERLAHVMLARFEDKANGAFFFTADEHDDLLMRSKSLSGGGNVPSPNGVAAQTLILLAQLMGEQTYQEAAERTLTALAPMLRQSPRALESGVFAAALTLSGERSNEPAQTQPLPEADASVDLGYATARLYASRNTIRPGESMTIAVALDIKDAWHLYGPNPEADFLIPTTVTLTSNVNALKVKDVRTPEPIEKIDPILKQKVATYEGRVWFISHVDVPADADAPQATLTATIKSQACDATRCLPPRTDAMTYTPKVDADVQQEGHRHEALFSRLLAE